jgi:hypothetical protein
VTFTRNVHAYETAHPASVSVPKHNDGSSSGTGIWVGGGVVMLLALAAAGVALWLRSRRNSESEEYIKYKSPEAPRRYLEKIMGLREQINDPHLQEVILACVKDTESYFARYSYDKERDATAFTNYLDKVQKVLQKYVDVQNNRRYYSDPARELSRGSSSIEDFADYVLQSCRNGSSSQLNEYTVNTQILQAQALR